MELIDGKPWYGADELAGKPGMKGSPQMVNEWGKTKPRQTRKALGLPGKGWLYPESCLPKATQAYFNDQRLPSELKNLSSTAAASLPAATLPGGGVPAGLLSAPADTDEMPVPAIIPHADAPLTDRQRLISDARQGVFIAAQHIQLEIGCNQEVALVTLIANAQLGKLDAHTQALLRLARDPRGRKTANSSEFPCLRTLKRWLAAPDTAPRCPSKDFTVPAWGPAFLRAWRQPQKPSVSAAYDEFIGQIPKDQRPTIHQVRRFLDKLPAIAREKGRQGPRQIKNIKPFVRRTFEQLWPEDIWSGDGHTFDAEVQHPLHGGCFRPEITTFVDIATRDVTGWSVNLAESAHAVIDAIRHGIVNTGVPATLYVDNGSGYKNAMLQDEAVGLLFRFGITIQHSLPYNSQARGVIERAHQSIWVRAAKTLPSYMGADMDPEAKKKHFNATRQGVVQSDGSKIKALPLSWAGFIRLCEDAIEAYRDRPHSGLPKFIDADGQRRHYTPREYRALRAQQCTAEGYAPVRIAPDEADQLFRPRVLRLVDRGEIRLLGNRYFAKDFGALLHGEQVQVAYDIHDAERVWVHDLDGRLMGTAEWNGNASEYMPKPVIQQAREGRAKGRIHRLEIKAEAARAELRGAPALEAIPASELPGMRHLNVTTPAPAASPAAEPVKPARAAQPLPLAFPDPSDGRARYQFWRDLQQRVTAGEALPDEYQRYVENFPKSREYRIWDEYFTGLPSAAQASG